MADRPGPLLLLLFAAAAFGAVPHYTAFTRNAEVLRPFRSSGPMPSFSFGPSSLFDNPALLAGTRGRDFALSGSDLAHPLSLAGSYTGSFLAHSAAGIGYSFDSRDDHTEQAAVLGYSASGEDLDIGINLRFMTQNGLENGLTDSRLFALDFDAGLLYSFRDRLFAGVSVFNLMSNDFYDTRTVSVSPQRSAKVQIGGHPLKDRFLTLFAEFRTDSLHDFHLDQWSAGGGVEAELLKQGLLRPHLAFLSRHRPELPSAENILAAGLGCRLSRSPDAFLLEYGAEVPVREDKIGRARHSITLAFNAMGEDDDIPPVALLRADNEYFTPNGDDKNDKVHLFLDASDQGGSIRKWALLILRKEKTGRPTLVKAWTGAGLPPRVVEWDGRNSAGELVEPGDFLCQFRVTDRARNHADSPYLSIKIH